MNYYARLEQNDNITMQDPDGLWFGDPCYVVPDHLWDTWCDKYINYEKHTPDLPRCYIAECRSEGHTFYTWSTAYGDGCYPLMIDADQVAKLGVDAGTLSVIPMSLIKRWHGEVPADVNELGHVVKRAIMSGQMTCDQGDFFWDDVRLPTGGVDEELEQEEEEFWTQEPEWV